MRKYLTVLAFAPFLLLAACGSEQSSYEAPERLSTVDVKEAAVTAADEADGGQPIAVSAPNAPRIAYVYDYGFRLPIDRLAGVQRRHADLCERKGSSVCRILEMQQDGSEGDYASGTLVLAVAAPSARAFGAELAKVAGEAEGSQISSSISGEDLSKQIVDTEARLKARTLLRDRLMEVLANRKGTVAELVEAERGVAQVNEEIDQARAWLTEMQGRVDFSRVNISYSSGARSSGGFVEPIRLALGNVSSVLGTIVAILIMAATVVIPLGLVGWAIALLVRRFRGKSTIGASVEVQGPPA